MTTWNPIDAPTDRCLIGGVLSPGVCEVQGASAPRKWEEKAGYAMTGAILVYRGIALARFTLVFRLYTTEHWEEWARVRPMLLKAPVGQISELEGAGIGLIPTRALDVDHPLLNEVNISHMVVEEVGAPEQTEDGVWTIQVKCIEWRRIGRGIGKPDGSQANETDPDAARLRVLGALNDENQMLKAALDKGNP